MTTFTCTTRIPLHIGNNKEKPLQEFLEWALIQKYPEKKCSQKVLEWCYETMDIYRKEDKLKDFDAKAVWQAAEFAEEHYKDTPPIRRLETFPAFRRCFAEWVFWFDHNLNAVEPEWYQPVMRIVDKMRTEIFGYGEISRIIDSVKYLLEHEPDEFEMRVQWLAEGVVDNEIA